MPRPSLITAAVATFLIPALAGCHNTDRSRDDARRLAKDLQTYRDAQDTRVRQLNREYQEAFSRLMDTLDDLSAASVQQGRDADAQLVADALVRDTFASLNGSFRGSFAKALSDQRQRIIEADAAVAAVRADYESTYAAAKLQTAKINLALKNLNAMSQDPDDTQRIREAIKFIQLVGDAAREAHEQAKAPPADQ